MLKVIIAPPPFMATIAYVFIKCLLVSILRIPPNHSPLTLKNENVILLYILNEMPMFDWCVVNQRGSQKNHQKTECGEYPGILRGILLIPHNIVMDLNNVMNWKDLCSQLRKLRLKKGRSVIESKFCWCFMVGMPTQQNIHGANLMGRSWRTWEMDWIAPTYFRCPFKIRHQIRQIMASNKFNNNKEHMDGLGQNNWFWDSKFLLYIYIWF